MQEEMASKSVFVMQSEAEGDEPEILEDICVEELAIDGICGVY